MPYVDGVGSRCLSYCFTGSLSAQEGVQECESPTTVWEGVRIYEVEFFLPHQLIHYPSSRDHQIGSARI